MSGRSDFLVEQTGAIRVVALPGEHDVSTLDRLKAVTSAAVEAGPVVVDLTDCGFIDSSCLAVLLHASQSAPFGGFAVVAANGSEPARLLGLVAFGQVVPVYATKEEALGAVSRR